MVDLDAACMLPNGEWFSLVHCRTIRVLDVWHVWCLPLVQGDGGSQDVWFGNRERNL